MSNKITFQKEYCKGCGLCLSACPKDLLEFSEETNEMGYNTVYLTDEEKCNGCGLCAVMCPDLAIILEKEEKTCPRS